MIDIRNVTKRFGAFTAVNDVSLQIHAGEFITLLGPSGCGKTTLLRMLSGFETPDAGSIHIDGQDVTPLAPYRRNVNQVFQSYALFPHMTVRDNIAFGLRMQKVAPAETRQRVAEVMDLVALGGFEDRLPSQLSGGQRQRVALARAFLRNAPLLILDEATSALDSESEAAIQLALQQLVVGKTVLIIAHRFSTIRDATKILVFDQGAIVANGTHAELHAGNPLYRSLYDRQQGNP